MDHFTTARTLIEQGFSVVPCGADKTPLVSSWKAYQSRTPTEAEIARWWPKSEGIALLGGRIQCLDFDEKYAKGILSRFASRVTELGLDYLLGELMQQRTPSGGFHLIWECDGPRPRNQKLASRPTTQAERKNEHDKVRVMIETRGDGGYFLIHPSPKYELVRGDWAAIPKITQEDEEALFSLARTFDEPLPETKQPEPSSGLDGHEETPGDDYDLRADIPALLIRHGWKKAGASGKYWTRPGKTRGISATWDVVPNRLFVFSSSTQFEPNHVYRPWHIYAILECGGDFSLAARELRRQGFGSSKPKPKSTEYQPSISPFEDDPPGVEYCPCGGGADPQGEAPTTETEEDKIRRLINARRFDQSKVPPPIRPTYAINGIVIATPGNIAAVTAPAKVGKSAFIAAMIASTMADPEASRDLLGVSGFNGAQKAVIYVDTEQSPDDFWHLVDRARRRAGEKEIPTWLRAFSVADLTAKQAKQALAIEMADAADQCGGIHSVFVDGIADLAVDVNDAAEANELVAHLHGQAIRYDTSILCVIHKNPGSEKVRGHLGSQLERKAETNLSLEKSDEVTVVWSNKQRRAPIDKRTGPRFRWDDDLKMHVSCPEEAPRPANKTVELLELAQSVLKPGDKIGWAGLIEALRDARRTPDKAPSVATAERWVLAMKKAGILEVSFGAYSLAKAAEEPVL